MLGSVLVLLLLTGVLAALPAAMGGRVLAETGATATVVLLQEGRIITANIGDSSAVLSRRGSPVLLSIEHRWVPGQE